MAKNLSLIDGVPSSKESAISQHEKLATKLKNNELFMFSSQNRGYLALENATGKYKGAFYNILYNTRPAKKGIIKLTQV